jgi:hypothetical protein
MKTSPIVSISFPDFPDAPVSPEAQLPPLEVSLTAVRFVAQDENQNGTTVASTAIAATRNRSTERKIRFQKLSEIIVPSGFVR